MELLKRSFSFDLTKTEDDKDDGLTLEGYAAVFDSPTRIRSWEGEFDEVIARGAFAKTISENTPVLQFDHGQHPMLGSIPLGSIKHLREDDRGLFVRARLSNNWLVEPVRDAIRDGAITGMSFRFEVIRDSWDKTATPHLRTLKEVRTPELGPVVFPAYQDTEVGVRSKELETLLSDADVRAALARLLTFGDAAPADTDAALSGTSADADAEPQPRTPHVSIESIAALKRRIDRTLKGV